MSQVVELARFFGALNGRLDTVRDTELREYQRFFYDLTPRLETTRVLERELDAKLARRFNVFDFLKSKSGSGVYEVTLSRVIADLLNPSGSHGQGPLFLECLRSGLEVHGLEWASGVSLKAAWTRDEQLTDDSRRLDVFVHIDKERCLAIENKPHATDSPNQINDYLRYLRKKYKKSLLIYLPGSGRRPAEESVTLDDLDVLDNSHLFRIMPYGRAGIGDWEDGFDEYRIDYSLADWLADCRKSCDIDRLRWFLREAEAFCERQFGGNDMADAETSTIKEFVLSDERSWNTALKLGESLPEILPAITEDVCKSAHKLISDSDKLSGLADDQRWSNEDGHIYMQRGSWPEHLWIGLSHHEWNGWYIGILWNEDVSDMTEEGQYLRRKLVERLEEELQLTEKDDGWWLCSEFLAEYKDWVPLIPALFKECEEGKGRITNYFIRKFVKVAKDAIPIIDRVAGTRST